MVTRIEAHAPVRVCDAGGWTDTWFAGHGVVCSVAVEPGARVAVEVPERAGPTVLNVAATGDSYRVPLAGALPGRHPLLETAIRRSVATNDRGLRIQVSAALPPGCGLGTSAAVVVALLAALDACGADDVLVDAGALATAAHDVEIGCGLQSGVQDQHAAAFGGANEMTIDPYPVTTVAPIALTDAVITDLDARLVTVYLGRPHVSSTLHERVIAELGENDARLAPLRGAATAAARALRAANLDAYGAALVENTRAQAALHPALVSQDAQALIDLATRFGAVGWKVNGAGGDGGSVTLLASSDPDAQAALIAAIDAVTRWRRLPLRFAPRGATTVARR